MGAFEHVISLLSFVYALAIAHMLLSISQIIRNWQRVRLSWLHAFWMAIAFAVLISNWLSYWDLHAIPDWSVGSIVFTFVMASVNYLQAALVCPGNSDGRSRRSGPVPPTARAPIYRRRRGFGDIRADCQYRVRQQLQRRRMDRAEQSGHSHVVRDRCGNGLAAALGRHRGDIVVAVMWAYYFADLQSALK
jgi:hypothetical protein